MRYLLDTHALLWALTDPARLGAHARAIVSARENTLVASAASAWEIATKHRLGRLPEADGLLRGYSRHLDRLGTERLAVFEEHALTAGQLEWGHVDPFDRILVAQGILESLPLVTHDSEITRYRSIRTVW